MNSHNNVKNICISLSKIKYCISLSTSHQKNLEALKIFLSPGLRTWVCHDWNTSNGRRWWKERSSFIHSFGERGNEDVIKVKWGHKDGAWSKIVSVLLRRDTRELSLFPCAERSHEHTVRSWPSGSLEDILTRNYHCSTLIWDF